MGHPTLSSEQIHQRDADILACADQHPKTTNVALGQRYGLNRETIRLILSRGRRQAARNRRLAAKTQRWGYRAP